MSKPLDQFEAEMIQQTLAKILKLADSLADEIWQSITLHEGEGVSDAILKTVIQAYLDGVASAQEAQR